MLIHRATVSDRFSRGSSIERRNPVDTIGKATPAILALLLSIYCWKNEYIKFRIRIILRSNSSAGIHFCNCLSAMIRRLNEEDCVNGQLLVVHSFARHPLLASSIILPIPLTYLSWFVLEGTITGDESKCNLLAVAPIDSDNGHFVRLDRTSHVGFRFEEVQCGRGFPSSGCSSLAVYPGSGCPLNDSRAGMTWELSTSSPLVSPLFASVIFAMVWAVAIFIPDA